MPGAARHKRLRLVGHKSAGRNSLGQSLARRYTFRTVETRRLSGELRFPVGSMRDPEENEKVARIYVSLSMSDDVSNVSIENILSSIIRTIISIGVILIEDGAVPFYAILLKFLLEFLRISFSVCLPFAMPFGETAAKDTRRTSVDRFRANGTMRRPFDCNFLFLNWPNGGEN